MAKQVKKELSGFQLISIISILVVVGLVLLISSGLFDSTAAVQEHVHTNTETTTPNNSPSVNLNVISEINKLEGIVNSNPENHEVLLQLGHLLNDNRFYDKAIVQYEKYLLTHPDNADVIVDMGVCYFELKKYDKAILVLENALKFNPKHQIAHFNLGIVNFANQNVIKAKEWWTKCKDLDPSTNIGIKAEELLKTNN